jgi:hypothetical protein
MRRALTGAKARARQTDVIVHAPDGHPAVQPALPPRVRNQLSTSAVFASAAILR